MRKITIELPDFVETVNKVACSVKPETWTEEQAQRLVPGFFLQGIRIILQRSTSEAEDPQRAIREKAAKIQSGNYQFGKGVGKASATPEQKAWVWFLNKMDVKEAGSKINNRNVTRAMETWVRQKLIQEFDPGTPERHDVEQNIGKHLETRYDEIVQRDQEETKPLRLRVEAERMQAEADEMF